MAENEDREVMTRGGSGTGQKKFRTIRHVAVTTDPRNAVVVIVAVLDDSSVWCSQGSDDWVELQGVPGTQARDEHDAGVGGE